jgi:hypothetical protein
LGDNAMSVGIFIDAGRFFRLFPFKERLEPSEEAAGLGSTHFP